MSERPDRLPALPRIGRPKKEYTRSQNLPPTVEIDFAREPADQILPCSDTDQAHHLGWRLEDVRGINRTLGLYEKLPMLCQAENCFWASQCPTAKTEPPFMFKGLRCPLEVMELYRNFVRYIRELGVHPDDHVDLNYIQDLCRIDLQLSHSDKRLQINGLEVQHVAAVAQRESLPFYESIAHPLLATQARLRADRNVIYKALLASRAEKKKVEQTEGKQKLDMLAALARLKEHVNEELIAEAAEHVLEGELAALPDGSGLSLDWGR